MGHMTVRVHSRILATQGNVMAITVTLRHLWGLLVFTKRIKTNTKVMKSGLDSGNIKKDSVSKVRGLSLH